MLVYQLSMGNNSEPAVYIAEVNGKSNDDLEAISMKLFIYQSEKQWHNNEIKSAIYSFIKHDIGTTKNIEICKVKEVYIGDHVKTNKIVCDLLLKQVSSHVSFMMNSDGTFSGNVLQRVHEPSNISGLSKFYMR